MTRGETIRY